MDNDGFTAIGVDAWDGSASQVDNTFRLRTSTTYPLLLKGSLVARDYGFDRHNYAVVDHQQVLRYRSQGSIGGRFDPEAIRGAIEVALAVLPVAAASPDFDGDGRIGFTDFFLFIDAFGTADPHFDLNGSGGPIDADDFFIFADHFGTRVDE